MPIRFITTKNNDCQVMAFDALLFLSKYNVAKFDNKNGIYAHPEIGICNASNRDPNTAPQNEMFSIINFMINSNMRLLEFVQNHMITHLLQLCKDELNLDELPNINILDDQPTVSGGTSFGEFDGTGINVISMGRHPIDIMRTLAHEIVHWKQQMEGQELDGNDGSETENEANAVAGIIMRKFGKMYPEYFVNTLPS